MQIIVYLLIFFRDILSNELDGKYLNINLNGRPKESLQIGAIKDQNNSSRVTHPTTCLLFHRIVLPAGLTPLR
jgi:hypothetical protein